MSNNVFKILTTLASNPMRVVGIRNTVINSLREVVYEKILNAGALLVSSSRSI